MRSNRPWHRIGMRRAQMEKWSAGTAIQMKCKSFESSWQSLRSRQADKSTMKNAQFEWSERKKESFGAQNGEFGIGTYCVPFGHSDLWNWIENSWENTCRMVVSSEKKHSKYVKTFIFFSIEILFSFPRCSAMSLGLPWHSSDFRSKPVNTINCILTLIMLLT